MSDVEKNEDNPGVNPDVEFQLDDLLSESGLNIRAEKILRS